jgi:hypothetical protein
MTYHRKKDGLIFKFRLLYYFNIILFTRLYHHSPSLQIPRQLVVCHPHRNISVLLAITSDIMANMCPIRSNVVLFRSPFVAMITVGPPA